jgi:hypothetical protein
MSPNLKSKLKNLYNSIKLPVVLPLVVLSMVAGAFGADASKFISSNFKIFADNVLSTGYGCGTFGQSEPKYGIVCTTATSIIVPNSSSLISSSAINTSSIFLSSQTSSLASTLSTISSSSFSNIISSSSNSTLVSASSQFSSALISSSSNVSSSQNASSPTLSVKINLSANYNTTTKQMDNTFKIRNMIPLSQPYNQPPFNYSGAEAYANAQSIPANAVDWILVEIKDLTKNSVTTKALILKQDGNVVDVNGSQTLSLNGFTPIQGYNYQVVVRHRNAVALATNQNINFSLNNNTTVDFTKNINVKATNQEQIGTDTQNQAIFGMRKANSNGSDSIDAQDRSVVLNTQESDGLYNSLDLNLDGVIDAQDRNVSLSAQEASENI